MQLTVDDIIKLKIAINNAVDQWSTPALQASMPVAMLQGVDTSTWTNTFNETFIGPLDLTRWDTVYPWSDPTLSGCSLPTNHEAQWYWNHRHLPSTIAKPWQVSNGCLTLVADNMPPLLKPTAGYISPPTVGIYNYQSGMIHNRNSFSQLYGYFEIEAQLPAGRGLWPAFWLLPHDLSWPPEIDIFEMLGHEPNKLYTTLHLPNINPNAHIEAWIDTSSFHRYGLRWTAQELTLFIDGKEAGGGRIPSALAAAMPMYMILNLAVGGVGSWPGSPDSTTTFPAKMNVRAIRAWSFN